MIKIRLEKRTIIIKNGKKGTFSKTLTITHAGAMNLPCLDASWSSTLAPNVAGRIPIINSQPLSYLTVPLLPSPVRSSLPVLVLPRSTTSLPSLMHKFTQTLCIAASFPVQS